MRGREGERETYRVLTLHINVAVAVVVVVTNVVVVVVGVDSSQSGEQLRTNHTLK